MKKNNHNFSKLILAHIFILLLFFILLLSFGCGKKEEQLVEPTKITTDKVPLPILPEEDEEETETLKETKKLKTDIEIASEVINGDWGNGKARYKALKKAGYDPNNIQKTVDELLLVEEEAPLVEYVEESNSNETYVYENNEALNSYNGVVYYNDHKETYYSQRVLPGGGLNIPGRHVAEDGTIRDSDGYICVAADPSYLPYGSLVETSLGTGKVYDSGCDYGTIDIYTDW